MLNSAQTSDRVQGVPKDTERILLQHGLGTGKIPLRLQQGIYPTIIQCMYLPANSQLSR